jgi:hypothetical protein
MKEAVILFVFLILMILFVSWGSGMGFKQNNKCNSVNSPVSFTGGSDVSNSNKTEFNQKSNIVSSNRNEGVRGVRNKKVKFASNSEKFIIYDDGTHEKIKVKT